MDFTLQRVEFQGSSSISRQIFRQHTTETEEGTIPKKGENIYKRKDGRWEGRYIRSHNAKGKAGYGYIYGKTYGEVKQKLLRMKVLPQQHPDKQDGKAVTYVLSKSKPSTSWNLLCTQATIQKKSPFRP